MLNIELLYDRQPTTLQKGDVIIFDGSSRTIRLCRGDLPNFVSKGRIHFRSRYTCREDDKYPYPVSLNSELFHSLVGFMGAAAGFKVQKVSHPGVGENQEAFVFS